MSDDKIPPEAPRCTCPCGCTYAMLSRISRASGLCRSCRTNLHYGGTPLPDEEDQDDPALHR